MEGAYRVVKVDFLTHVGDVDVEASFRFVNSEFISPRQGFNAGSQSSSSDNDNTWKLHLSNESAVDNATNTSTPVKSI